MVVSVNSFNPECTTLNLPRQRIRADHALLNQRCLLNDLIPHIVFSKSCCNSQFPHKIVNVFFTLVIVKNKLTDLRGG